MNTNTLLKITLLVGVAYFLAMATAHFFSFKVPLLFVYWDNPFFAYQDKIISFCVLVYAALFYAAFKHRDLVPLAVASLVITIAGLTAVTFSPELSITLENGSLTTQNGWHITWQAMEEGMPQPLTKLYYWLQIGFIAFFATTVSVLYLASAKK